MQASSESGVRFELPKRLFLCAVFPGGSALHARQREQYRRPAGRLRQLFFFIFHAIATNSRLDTNAAIAHTALQNTSSDLAALQSRVLAEEKVNQEVESKLNQAESDAHRADLALTKMSADYDGSIPRTP